MAIQGPTKNLPKKSGSKKEKALGEEKYVQNYAGLIDKWLSKLIASMPRPLRSVSALTLLIGVVFLTGLFVEGKYNVLTRLLGKGDPEIGSRPLSPETHSKLKVGEISENFSGDGVTLRLNSFQYLHSGRISLLEGEYSGLKDGNELWVYIKTSPDMAYAEYYPRKLTTKGTNGEFTFSDPLSLGSLKAALDEGGEAKYELGFLLSKNSTCSGVLAAQVKVGLSASALPTTDCSDLGGIAFSKAR